MRFQRKQDKYQNFKIVFWTTRMIWKILTTGQQKIPKLFK